MSVNYIDNAIVPCPEGWEKGEDGGLPKPPGDGWVLLGRKGWKRFDQKLTEEANRALSGGLSTGRLLALGQPRPRVEVYEVWSYRGGSWQWFEDKRRV